MELRNLKRWHLFERALYKHYKKTGEQHTEREIHILFCIYLLQPCSARRIFDYTYKVRRSLSYENVCNILALLIGDGLITKEDDKYYNVTHKGYTLLTSLETRLRKERHDK